MTTETAYVDGVRANLSREPSSSNPHPSATGKGLARTAWYDGWYDTWRILKYGICVPSDTESQKIITTELDLLRKKK